MDFLGIGPLELIFILLIALIVFGPKDIARAGRTVGRFMRKVVTSEGWKSFQRASKDMRNLPNTLMREAGLEEEELKRMTGMADLEKTTSGIEDPFSPWTTPPSKNASHPKIPERATPWESKSLLEVDSEEPPSPLSITSDD
ncbi:MAG: twin-arginine translocase TatA/TatE family subunit [Chloroflexi bacterium]|nr:twin-arginine translocase TatA/TatE family subunit [Chloroflexota bacterium]